MYFSYSLLSGAIFEQGTDEVQSAFKFAMMNHNQNLTTRKFELQAFVDVINTADAYKLSRLSEYIQSLSKIGIIIQSRTHCACNILLSGIGILFTPCRRHTRQEN